MFLLGSIEPAAQVVVIAVEKSLALDKIDEHQPVQHHGGVPLMVLLDRNAGDELEESRVLLTELVVEAFGNPLQVKSFKPTRYVDNRKRFFLSKVEGNSFKLLDESFTVLASMKSMLSASGWFSRRALNPLPDLRGLFFIDVQKKVFVNGLGHLPLDLAAGGVIGNRSVGLWLAGKDDHSLLLCDCGEIKHLTIDRDS
jgi:hypothetical protein